MFQINTNTCRDSRQPFCERRGGTHRVIRERRNHLTIQLESSLLHTISATNEFCWCHGIEKSLMHSILHACILRQSHVLWELCGVCSHVCIVERGGNEGAKGACEAQASKRDHHLGNLLNLLFTRTLLLRFHSMPGSISKLAVICTTVLSGRIMAHPINDHSCFLRGIAGGPGDLKHLRRYFPRKDLQLLI